MNNRPIKFRAWDDRMVYSTFPDKYGGGLTSADILSRFENVMQFTGLHDKNGKEIYEADVVKLRDWKDKVGGDLEDIEAEVIWDINCWKTRTKKGWQTGLFDPSDKKFGCEVIGNLYENPELLK